MNQPLALVVEDEPAMAMLFARALEKAGFATETVEAGDTALARLAELTPDVIFLDLWLPVVDGVSILRQVRANARLAQAQVVIITADPAAARSLDLDADLLLIKPISLAQLTDLARRLLPAR